MVHLVAVNLLLLAAFILGAGVYIVLRLWRAERRERTRRRLEATYDTPVLAALNAANPLEQLGPLRAIPARHRELVVRLLCGYGEWLKGEAAGNFAAMMDALGFTAEQAGLLGDRRWWVRARAAWRVGLVRHRPSRDALIGLLADPHPFVRLTAAVALARLGDPGTIPHLLHHLGGGPNAQPLFLKTVLERFGEQALPHLRSMLRAAEPPRRHLAVEMLGHLGDVHSAETITAALDHPDTEMRTRAARALGTLGGEDACRKLLDLVDDDSWELRTMAVRALGELGYRPAVGRLAEVLADDHFTVRVTAGRALLALGREGQAALAAGRHVPDRYARDVVEQMLAVADV